MKYILVFTVLLQLSYNSIVRLCPFSHCLLNVPTNQTKIMIDSFFSINSCAIKFKVNEIVNSKNGWKCEEVRCANRGLQKQEFYEW